MTPETSRQLIHLCVVAFALPVPFIGPTWAVVLAGVAVFANWVVIPLTGRDKALMREGERFLNGIRWYPVAVLFAQIALPLALAQAAWAILAFGDAFSNLFGRRYGRVKLPWNRAKSWAGTIGFVATAFPASLGLWWLTQHFAPGQSFLTVWADHGLSGPFSIGVVIATTLLGSLVAALFESLPIPLDDNLTVTGSAAIAMAACVIAVGA